MKTVKSKRLKAIGLFIILIALILSYYKHVYNAKPVYKPILSKETDNYFEQSRNNEKIRLDIEVKSLDDLRKLIDQVIEPAGARKVISNEQTQQANYIYLLESGQISPVLDAVSQVAVIRDRNEINTPASGIDLEEKLRIRTAEFERLRSKTNITSYDRTTLKQIEYEIDSLRTEISNQKNKSLSLLYLKAHIASNKIGRFTGAKNFLVGFVFYVIIGVVAVALLYYGTILLMYLLAMMGVKMPSLSGYLGKGYNDYAGYKGYRGYGSYGYGGSRKRHVKRIYRNKRHSDSDSQEDDNK
jgi:hypothetical protein